MPWHLGKKTAKGYPIIRSDTHEVVGYSKTKKKGWASIAIRREKSGH